MVINNDIRVIPKNRRWKVGRHVDSLNQTYIRRLCYSYAMLFLFLSLRSTPRSDQIRSDRNQATCVCTYVLRPTPEPGLCCTTQEAAGEIVMAIQCLQCTADSVAEGWAAAPSSTRARLLAIRRIWKETLHCPGLYSVAAVTWDIASCTTQERHLEQLMQVPRTQGVS